MRAVCLLACPGCLTAVGAALSPFPNAPSGGDWHTVHDAEWTQEAVMVGGTPSTPEAAPHYGESWYLPDNRSGLLVDVWNTIWRACPTAYDSASQTFTMGSESLTAPDPSSYTWALGGRRRQTRVGAWRSRPSMATARPHRKIRR